MRNWENLDSTTLAKMKEIAQEIEREKKEN